MSEKDRVVRLTRTVTRDRDSLAARCREVEVTSQGDAIEAVLANLRDALELYFKDGPGPAGSEPIIAPVEIRIPA